jgi:ribokinase
MRIALNPSPFDDKIKSDDLDKVTWLLFNEIEGQQITGRKQPEEILGLLRERYPDIVAVLTLGSKGVIYQDKYQEIQQPAYPVTAVDTTAAGDTFVGYFLAGAVRGEPMRSVLRKASVAAALSVSKKGAADSIPSNTEVEKALKLLEQI